MSVQLSLNQPRALRAIAVVAGFAFAVAQLLTACGGGASSSGMPAQSSSSARVTALPASGKARVFKSAQLSSAKNANAVGITASSSPGTSIVQLQLPEGADAKSLLVTLNGKNITDRFSTGACAQGECMKAAVSASDGYATKNVLSATVKNKSGGLASGRARFAQASAPSSATPATLASRSSPSVAAASTLTVKSATSPTAIASPVAPKALTASTNVCDPTTMCPPWLPPSVSFNTLQAGGWNSSTGAWIQVNGQTLPSVAAPSNCSGAHYAAVVLDRQTLIEKTNSPESSPQCFVAAADLKTYLATLTANDLVIAGTVWGQNAASDLDTTPIGGTSYAKATHVPEGYMVIGAGAQQAGSAYENYYDSNTGDPQFNAFATGSLQEDANGNYSFQSSDIVEYAISPNDPTYFTSATESVIAMNIPADMAISGETRRIYSVAQPFNGFWLLVLDRTTLQPAADQGCTPSAPTNGTIFYTCGSNYAVGSDTAAGPRDANWNALATALNNVNQYQLAFLVSSGAVGTTDLPTTVQSGQNYTGFANFAAALTNLGGTAALVAGPKCNATDSYSLIGFSGASNPLAGGAVEASTMLAQQGQFGILHGTLLRNLNGLFQPGQTSQEPQPVFAAKGGLDDSDFSMAIASFQQPVDWPSNSATTPLPGADSIAGQLAAYRFISHWLLAQYYVKGISGPHQDDLHYFFSGSSNTWIDYHTMDPVDLPFPSGNSGWNNFQCDSASSSGCTYTAPADSAASTFTSGDFAAVQKQMSLEVQYLTNTLQFLVSGSTNMKDVIAAGNANVGLALSGAASTILASKFQNEEQIPTTTQVSFSWQSLLGLIGGIASTVANAEGVGELLAPEQWKNFGDTSPNFQRRVKNGVGIANTIGALVSAIGSGGSMVSKTNSGAVLPSSFVKFTTTIGDLANGELQSPLIVGFDVMADNLTSDWARLQSIGPRVVDVNDPLYAPNQVTQNTALQALTNASAQTFYISLLPAFYHVDFWSTVYFTPSANPAQFQPLMGSTKNHLDSTACFAFYVTPNTANTGYLSVYQGLAYPTPGNPGPQFTYDTGNNDVLVIAGLAEKPRTYSTYIPSLDPTLATTLFAPDQLNLSMHQFVAANGPLTRINASTGSPSGWSADQICDMNQSIGATQAPTASSSDTDINGNIDTTTTLTSGSRDTFDGQTVLTAVIDAAGKPVASGTVYFSIDGKLVGQASVGTDGTATLTLPQIALGNHSIVADFSPADGYAVSSSTPTTLGVYTGSPDLNVTAASPTLAVSYDKPSQPLELTIGSVAGLAGNVQLSCTGLPAGMSCTFDTPSPTLAADGSVQTSVIIGPTVATQAALGLLLLPMLIIGWRREDGSVRRRTVPAILALCMAAATLTGCSGDNSSTPRETGTKTVLINASVGGVSRSVAVAANIN